MTANVTDDDIAGATITPTNVVVSEDGATSDLRRRARRRADADVTIDITVDAQVHDHVASLDVHAAQLERTRRPSPSLPSTTSSPSRRRTPADHPRDVEPGARTSTAALVSDVTVDIADNDIPGVTVSRNPWPSPRVVAGASFDDVRSTASRAPTSTSSSPSLASSTRSQPSRSRPANWNVVQPIAINAFDDFIMEGTHATTITIDTSSLAPAYDTGVLTIADVDVDITDNDTAGVLLAPSSGLSGAEGGPNVTYDMSLTSEPTDTITITLAGDADGAPRDDRLHLHAWRLGRPADRRRGDRPGPDRRGPAHDVDHRRDRRRHRRVLRRGHRAHQDIAITDDDTAGVTFTPVLPGPLAIAEGGATATYDVVLDTEPTGDVTIDIVALAGQATASPATLTFTSGNWMTPQTVTVTAADDAVAETTPHFDSLTHVAGGPIRLRGVVLGDMDLADRRQRRARRAHRHDGRPTPPSPRAASPTTSGRARQRADRRRRRDAHARRQVTLVDHHADLHRRQLERAAARDGDRRSTTRSTRARTPARSTR